MRVTLALLGLGIVLLAPGCATPSGPPPPGSEAQPLDCILIAEVARTQYEFSHDRPLPLDRVGYAPRCDWASLGLHVVERRAEDLAALEPLVTFGRPWGLGDERRIKAAFWNGLHTFERTCRLRRDGRQWRLVEPCPVTRSF